MYGSNHSSMLPRQGEAHNQQQQSQQQQQQLKQHNQSHGLTPWAPPASICPPSPFDTLLRPATPQDGAQLSIASPFDFPSIPNSGSTFLSSMSGGALSSTSLSNRVPPSPFDRPGASIGAGRVQQLLQNSQFGGHSMGRPPALPLDRAARSPFDVALGQSHRSLQTASSGSVQHSALRLGGGLPLGEGFRSLERSLGSECSPATSYGTHEGGDDLDGVTQANVERHQQMYVRYSGMSEAVPCTEWSARESLAAEAGAMNEIDLRQRAEDMPQGVTLRIMSAPASFALPMVQRKSFKPAFQVRMEVSYRKQLFMPVTMEVHPANDQAHGKMEQWAPDSEKMQAELEGNRLSKTMNGLPGAHGMGVDVVSTPREALHLEDFRFTDLKWAKSSRMSKRWLVFFVRIKNDIIYLLYKLPTVVISRRTDQYSKAHEILTGVAASAAKRPRTAPMLPTTAASVPPPGMLQRLSSGKSDGPKLVHASTAPEGAFRDAGGQPLVIDGAYIRQWIHLRYKACNFKRYMSESDMSALLHEAGVYPGAPGSSSDAFPVDPVKWESFKNWFLKALNVLLHVGQMWEATRPHAICGFAVTRETAEALLMVQPTGTFLVRLSSQPGALAISCCVEQSPGSQAFVDHLLVDHVDLVNRDLPSWVHAHIYATHLLDFLGEKRHPKELIFGPGTPKAQQAGSPRGSPVAPAESPRQAQPTVQLPPSGQNSPQPKMPSPLPMRSPGSSSPSNMPLDHLLMLANMTNTQPEEWSASPGLHGNQLPGMQGAGNSFFQTYQDGQQLPDIPERELSLDVLNMDPLGTQRLESLGALGNPSSLGSMGNLGSNDQHSLGSLGRLGLNLGSRSKPCLSESLGRGEPLGQRLESLNGQGLCSDSLDGISRQLLGSLGNLPENDPVLQDLMGSMASAPATLGEYPEGRGLANMDVSHGPWGSLGDMTSLNSHGGSLLTDMDPARMASARGNLAPLGGSSFTFMNPMGDTEMADAAHMTPNLGDQRFSKSPQQQQQFQEQQQHQHFQDQQQQQQQFAFQDNYWDPLISDDPQSFKYGGPFGHGFNNNNGQG